MLLVGSSTTVYVYLQVPVLAGGRVRSPLDHRLLARASSHGKAWGIDLPWMTWPSESWGLLATPLVGDAWVAGELSRGRQRGSLGFAPLLDTDRAYADLLQPVSAGRRRSRGENTGCAVTSQRVYLCGFDVDLGNAKR